MKVYRIHADVAPIQPTTEVEGIPVEIDAELEQIIRRHRQVFQDDAVDVVRRAQETMAVIIRQLQDEARRM